VGHPHYRFVGLMLFTATLDYFIGKRMAVPQASRLHHAGETPAVRRGWLVLSLASNLGVLGFFKYFNFFADNAWAALNAIGVAVPHWQLQILLPVSISFYTFQSLAYTIDLYRGQVQPARCLRDYLLFISYFPHLVAGPINRPQSLLAQCQEPRRLTWENWTQGATLILFGLFKKIAVADVLAPLADQAFTHPERCSCGTLLIGLYCFSFQIYADFSGYTDIARGLAKLMGFELMRNFDQPYFASNVTAFWRRWHISLSSWLRDYLYIPLGGNRLGRARTYLNLFLTMFLGGLWHGASWAFAVWGVLHGVYLAAHRLWLGGRKAKDELPPRGLRPGIVHAVKVLATFHLVALAWIFFRAGSPNTSGFACAFQYLRGLWPFGPHAHVAHAVRFDSDRVGQAVLAIAALVLLIDLPQYLKREHCVVLSWRFSWRVAAFALLCVWLIMLRETENVPFIYFQF
jgi:D-alanyl-lipoteichoic acid acyltransferase DltB (MBOAT superfamily)